MTFAALTKLIERFSS